MLKKTNRDPLNAKPRKRVPFEFVLEALEAADPRTNPMFGCTAVYVGPKIVFILRDKAASAVTDNGVWIATTHEHHSSLRVDFPNMRPVKVLGNNPGWQILPADAADFEESAMRACELVLRGDVRIGKIPKRKARLSKRQDSPGRQAGGSARTATAGSNRKKTSRPSSGARRTNR
jgi:hypothetical protein